MAEFKPGDRVYVIDAGLAAMRSIMRNATGKEARVFYELRDCLYRGEGPDIEQDSDIRYGEWVGNYADACAARVVRGGET